MPEVLTAGEILVEIMRKDRDVPLWVQGDFRGPFPSGAPAIFIDQVAALGHSAAIIGSVGDDEFGRKIVRRLTLDGVDVSYIETRTDSATAVAFVSYSKMGERKFLYHIARTAAGQFKIPAGDKLRGVRLFHVMGCSLMVSKEVRERIVAVAEHIRNEGGLISFDPNIRVELLKDESLDDVIGPVLEKTDILLPGERELLSITGRKTREEAAGYLFSQGVSTIVIKRGREGAVLITGDAMSNGQSFPIREVDPTGAGDAFDAGFVCGYLEGLEPEKALELAGACGALNASYFGPMEGVFHRNYVNYFICKHG